MKTASFNSIATMGRILVWIGALSSASTAMAEERPSSLFEHAATKTPIPGDASSSPQQLPHIVMIVMDDLGSHDLGLHGTGIHTPHIDGFVSDTNANGIYLDDYYVLPYCSPTRAALLSGMYPLQTGVHNVIEPRSTAGLPLGVETLPQMLKRANSGDAPRYQTHAVGKWHVGHAAWNQTPTFRGFDSFFGFYGGGEHYFTHQSAGATDLHFDRVPHCGRGCSQIVDERGNYSTHVFTREAIRVVEDHTRVHGTTGAPLFLYLAYQAVHCPNEVPPEYTRRYENRTDWNGRRKTYAGMLEAADEGIGNLTRALKTSGLWENTLVIVTTDNGGPTTVGCPQGSSNYPKRGGKCSLWEGGTTGDALIAGPALDTLLARTSTAPMAAAAAVGKADSDKSTPTTATSRGRFPFLFHVVDWFPTLAEWVGVVPTSTNLDGVSQAEALARRRVPARTELFGGYAYWEDDTTGKWWGPSIRHLNWKLVQGTSAGPDARNAMPDGTETIVPPGDGSGGYLLFDLEEDPGETTDLSEAYPEILEKMIYRLKLYRKSFVYPQENDDAKCPFPGYANSTVGPAWLPWCDGYREESSSEVASK